jgi:hypothetical protein
MAQIEELAKKQSKALTAYDIAAEQARIFPSLNEEQKEGAILFETLSYTFSSGVIQVLARHLREVDPHTKLYIAKEIIDESGHFSRCAQVCRTLGITPRDFFPDVGLIYGRESNWLRYMAGCAFTLEQTAARVFGKFLRRGNRYFEPLAPFVAEDVDHFSHSIIQLQEALAAEDGVARENRTIIANAITESLEGYARPFFQYLTDVMVMGASIERREVQLEWRAALLELAGHCERLGLEIKIEACLDIVASDEVEA